MDIKADYSGQEIGKYYLVQKLGNGGFGAVYRAHDRILKTDKAIKILEVKNLRGAYKLFNEAAIPYKCRHNHIIKINSGELVQFNGEILFVVDMDLANGESIESILKKRYISIIDSLNIIKDILFAVEYSHISGNIHRDIKPANILMDNNVPKLSDFGLSTALGSVIVPWKRYVSHAAPETFVNDSVATIETDIYAIGITLYRMVNNISDWKLFLNGIPNAQKHIYSGKLIDKLPMAGYVPKKVQRIIKKACKKLPDERYRSASEMRNEIEKLKLGYNWNPIDTNHWKGIMEGYPTREIYIDIRRKTIEVVVLYNGRKKAAESKKFIDLMEAQDYVYSYIQTTTLT